MTSLKTRSVVLFLCWVSIAQCRAKDLPLSFDDYLAIVNGRYDNSGPDKTEGQDTISMEARPALAPGLQEEPVMYIEEAINGKLRRMVVLVKNELSTDNILVVTAYNFTDPSQHEPGTFTNEDLANLKREDFSSNEGCVASYERTSDTSIMGEETDCKHEINGQHPSYTSVFTCDSMRGVAPVPAEEKTTLVPYDLQHRGARYPLIGAPEGYVNPCSDDP